MMLNKAEKVLPYKNSDKEKKQQIAEMFDNIAAKYDFLNHFLSFNTDKIWRKKAIKLLKKQKYPETVLDIATGTGDFALKTHKIIQPKKITGIDISEGMLEVARKKIEKKGLSQIIEFKKEDSENLSFGDNTFDAVTVAFGVRNFANLQNGLNEMFRVLKPGGKVVILEFSKPEKFPVKQLYSFYSKYLLPFFGKLFSKDKSAYEYLPDSVKAFPYGEDFLIFLKKTGFKNTKIKRLTFGIASVYYAEK